jgi:hypothetical protein
MKDYWVYLKEEFSDAFLEQSRIRVHGGRDIRTYELYKIFNAPDIIKYIKINN